MITSSDIEYKKTKLIKQGKSTINPDFKEIADWLNKQYCVHVINILYTRKNKDKISRLEFCVEEIEDEEILKKKEKYILKKILGIIKQKNMQTKYNPQGLFLIFSCFQTIAKAEANENILEEELNVLKKEYGDIWAISNAFAYIVFFVYTEEQKKKYQNSEIAENWRKRYFDILKKYDEFDYYQWDTFQIDIDSKENFDKNYEGNWYYYYK